MRDWWLPFSAQFISFLPLWQVRWLETTPAGPVLDVDRWRLVVGGMRWLPKFGAIAADRVVFQQFWPPVATSLPDGSYYVPPPYEVANIEGYPLQSFRGFFTTVV